MNHFLPCKRRGKGKNGCKSKQILRFNSRNMKLQFYVLCEPNSGAQREVRRRAVEKVTSGD